MLWHGNVGDVSQKAPAARGRCPGRDNAAKTGQCGEEGAAGSIAPICRRQRTAVPLQPVRLGERWPGKETEKQVRELFVQSISFSHGDVLPIKEGIKWNSYDHPVPISFPSSRASYTLCAPRSDSSGEKRFVNRSMTRSCVGDEWQPPQCFTMIIEQKDTFASRNYPQGTFQNLFSGRGGLQAALREKYS